MFGLGWALTGACPVPLVALVGAGASHARGHDLERARRHLHLRKASSKAPRTEPWATPRHDPAAFIESKSDLGLEAPT